MKQGKNSHKDIHRLCVIALMAMGAWFTNSNIVRADDTEVFTASGPTSKNSNVVFVLDTSGSMNDKPSNGFSSDSKIQIVKNVFESLIFDMSKANHSAVNPVTEGINIGVMRFNDAGDGGYFISEMSKLDNSSMGTLWDAVKGLTGGGNTPLAETAYEAYRYFAGLPPLYGDGKYTNLTGIMNGNNYKSPFKDPNLSKQCSINNHLVILTDGKPNGDNAADDAISTLTGSKCSYPNNDCLPEVAKYLYNNDFYNPKDGSLENVITHTIAFDLNDTKAMNLLAKTSEYGHGSAEMANDASGLEKVILGIFKSVVNTTTSFAGPAISVSSANRFVNDRTVYYSLFKPKLTPQWPGNLKGYQFDNNGILKDFDPDSPKNALDETGQFASDAISKWSKTADGKDIAKGGAAAQIADQTNRVIVTQKLDDATALIDLNDLKSANTGNNDTAVNDAFDPDGAGAITMTNDERDAIIDWTTSRKTNPVLDPLHSAPQVVDYGGDIGKVVFFGTNAGLLHAIDAETGQEKFAFIPSELLKHLKTLRDNSTTQLEHVYGLDGPITVYKDASSVSLIIGMRRGGSSYYALDVTNPDKPEVKWQITGGQGNFKDLGQTWAKPIVTSINTGNINSPTVKKVVLLSGGYDTQYDTYDAKISKPKGNAIYAVNLSNGELVWTADNHNSDTTDTHLQLSDMNDAIPAEVSAIDINSDGVADRLYTIDITGHLFRIDLNTTVTSNSNTLYRPSGRLFADLSGNNRHFYYSVDVAFSVVGTRPVLHLNVGSGIRANPLNLKTTDSFFSVWDLYPKVTLDQFPDYFTAIKPGDKPGDLTNTTTLNANPNITAGWYFDLNGGDGEKVLSEAASLGGYVFFTTYTPPKPGDVNPGSCEPPLGQGKLYAVKLSDSSPLSSNGRFVALQSTGIPAGATFMTLDLIPPGDNGDYKGPDTKRVVLVGGQNPFSDEPDVENKLNQSDTTRTYWQIVN